MSRSGYIDDDEFEDPGVLNLWRANVRRTLGGKRGQAFLRELLAALDAMPTKRLIQEDLVTPEGDCCAMGSVCLARGVDTKSVDPEEPEDVAALLGISPMMAREIAYWNDEDTWVWRQRRPETPEERWVRMRAWVAARIQPEHTEGPK